MRFAIALLILLFRVTAFAAVFVIWGSLVVQDMRLRWLARAMWRLGPAGVAMRRLK
jgi:hypothetical protein